MAKSAIDAATLSNVDDVRQKHISLSLKTDFRTKQIIGKASITFHTIKNKTTKVILDTFGLIIKSVVDHENNSPLTYEHQAPVETFGQALAIDIPVKSQVSESKFTIDIFYETTDKGGAIQWLPPSQTENKVHPYLFTQGQAIHSRSFLPCQDCPGVKVTWDARVTVPKALTAVMSALGNGDAPENYSTSTTEHTFSFHQPVPVSTYLISLAVGELEFESIGERTGVWGERGVVERSAYEFASMEKMVKAGEEVCGEYVWTRYDVLVLPGSFPYGGMENPCLTFATPTLLAGDRSLSDVIIHEIVHSWMGNLVTNSNWKHFWLNEGWTMFVQRKIMQKLYGSPVAEFDACRSVKDLVDTVALFGTAHNFTRLCPCLTNVDPDDSFSRIPYEKGFHLLRYLETVVGGNDAFAPFIKAYVKEFAYKTLDSEDFKAFFMSYFASVDGIHDIDWNLWFNGTGMPPVKNKFDESLAKEAVALKDRWVSGKGDGCESSDIQGWRAMQIMYFIDLLQIEGEEESSNDDDNNSNSNSSVFQEKYVLDLMDRLYGFTKSGNSEIRFRWQILCIKAEIEEIIPHAVKLLTEQGRMKFTRPLYRALYQSKMGREIARETFVKNQSRYHAICAKMVSRDLGLS